MTGDGEQPGIFQMTVEDVFETAMAQPHREFTLSMSVIQVYNEEVQDLLQPPGTPSLKVRGGSKTGFFCDAKKVPVKDYECAMEVLRQAISRRAVVETKQNKTSRCVAICRICRPNNQHTHPSQSVSSRSHTLYRLFVESSPRPPALAGAVDPSEHSLAAVLTFVDLAGSESVRCVFIP